MGIVNNKRRQKKSQKEEGERERENERNKDMEKKKEETFKAYFLELTRVMLALGVNFSIVKKLPQTSINKGIIYI